MGHSSIGASCGSNSATLLTVPRRADERLIEGMVTLSPNGFVPPCIPTLAAKPTAAPGWVHEIKHDGYRLIVRRDGDAVRLFTRRGYDWTARYAAIAGATPTRMPRS
jgi:ATP-dependent DNA ligase